MCPPPPPRPLLANDPQQNYVYCKPSWVILKHICKWYFYFQTKWCLLIWSQITVSNQLSKKTNGSTPHSEMIWQFLQHCVDTFPECFIGMEQHGSLTDIAGVPGTSNGNSHENGIGDLSKGELLYLNQMANSILIRTVACSSRNSAPIERQINGSCLF